MTAREYLARAARDAYFLEVEGRPPPPFESLADNVKRAWCAAVERVAGIVDPDRDLGE